VVEPSVGKCPLVGLVEVLPVEPAALPQEGVADSLVGQVAELDLVVMRQTPEVLLRVLVADCQVPLVGHLGQQADCRALLVGHLGQQVDCQVLLVALPVQAVVPLLAD